MGNLEAGFAAVLIGCLAGGADNPADDGAAFESLRAELRKGVPGGWGVEVSFMDATNPARSGPQPALVVSSDEPLDVAIALPGQAPGGGPQRARERVTIRLVATRHMTADEHRAAREANAAIWRERQGFADRRLKDVPWAHKGGGPAPPEAFRPRTGAERRLLLEYAYLWLEAEPRDLPTHHAAGLAFRLDASTFMKVRDERKAREYDRILEAIGKLVVPYETP